MPPADVNKMQEDLSLSEQQLRSIIESFVELGVSVYDFPGTLEATQGMMTNLKRNVDRLRQLNKQSNDPESQLNNFNVPIEVAQYIEDGRNPDVYTRDFVEAIRRSNQYQRAKMNALGQLRNKLAEKIIAEFPDMQNNVTDILARTRREPSV
ncbi:mediator complex subunit NUT2 [Lachancea thermotolerans CBS 6340]|uniref:Mediator of RNA polymerase II transcription subunit 10 n=1 Tax=Lachancea thermotolerans (strain ATCC 56472 / CBS 6340 / NRRL Y-8284) TaxID=559295 RepID=C5DJS2_LACTC|nr:KLTH0F18678p [Lachancea thermotolerans CBS 6340]CAR24561.1 KLTH0F18678p [Lachancea thermotolerans CBS 6340]